MTRVASTSNIAYVPTAAMMAGDFTAFCLAGVQQRPPDHAASTVREQPDRPGAIQPGGNQHRETAAHHTDPCGETRYAQPDNRDESQIVSRVTINSMPARPCSAGTC
jgi:hypothetical protein